MRYEEFYELRNRLIIQNKRFDENELKKLSYNDLYAACCGGASEAACSYELMDKERKSRMDSILNLSIQDVETDKCKWEVLDDMDMYYEYYSMKAPTKLESIPKWKLLVNAMQNLRGDWSAKRKSIYLKQIYELLPEVEKEGEVPIGWCKAVKNNADQFDGKFNDGRIMRDGSLLFPVDIAKKYGIGVNVSGNMAKLLGAKHEIRASGYRGSYEELFEKLLTPEQKLIYMFVMEDEE